MNLREFLAPSTRQLFDKYLQRIRQNTIDAGLMRVVTKDGAERIWMYRNVRITDANTAPHVVGHALDITDRIRAEEALRASEQNLKRAHDDLNGACRNAPRSCATPTIACARKRRAASRPSGIEWSCCAASARRARMRKQRTA